MHSRQNKSPAAPAPHCRQPAQQGVHSPTTTASALAPLIHDRTEQHAARGSPASRAVGPTDRVDPEDTRKRPSRALLDASAVAGCVTRGCLGCRCCVPLAKIEARRAETGARLSLPCQSAGPPRQPPAISCGHCMDLDPRSLRVPYRASCPLAAAGRATSAQSPRSHRAALSGGKRTIPGRAWPQQSLPPPPPAAPHAATAAAKPAASPHARPVSLDPAGAGGRARTRATAKTMRTRGRGGGRSLGSSGTSRSGQRWRRWPAAAAGAAAAAAAASSSGRWIG